MKEYPHGLDKEMLPRDLEIEEKSIANFEPDLPEAKAQGKALFLKILGQNCRFAAGYAYALDEPRAKVGDLLDRSLEYSFEAFKLGITIDVYIFIQLLSLAAVVGDRDAVAYLANSKRSRYENPNIEADKLTFVVAGLMSAFFRRDKAATDALLAENNPETMETKTIYRYDRMIYFPLLLMMNAIYKKDSNKFAAALQTREKEFIGFFSRASEKNDPEALIDLPGLAVGILARKHGIEFTDKSVYRPYELVS